MAEWHKGMEQSAQSLVLRMEKSRASAGSFSGFDFFEHIVILSGLLKINNTIPEIEQKRMLNQAVFAAGKSSPVTPSWILREVKALESAYLKQPLRQFILLSGISVNQNQRLSGCRSEECHITFGKNPGKKARLARQDRLHEARSSILADPPHNYLPLAIRVSAKSPAEAGEMALDGIDLVRGLWNLWLNHNQSWRWSSGRLRPINKIFLSPIHTLHNPDGSLASDTWWYDPSYKQPMDCLWDKDKLSGMVKFESTVRRRVRKHQYANDVRNAVIRYGRALDSDDFNDVFLRLWGLMEYLTATVSSAAKNAIKRAAFLFQEADYSYQTLTYLSEHRNRFVHTGSESNEIEALVFLLKRHVEALLLFHIRNHFKFASLHEAAEFMDMPASQNELAKRLNKLRQAMKFITAP